MFNWEFLHHFFQLFVVHVSSDRCTKFHETVMNNTYARPRNSYHQLLLMNIGFWIVFRYFILSNHCAEHLRLLYWIHFSHDTIRFINRSLSFTIRICTRHDLFYESLFNELTIICYELYLQCKYKLIDFQNKIKRHFDITYFYSFAI